MHVCSSSQNPQPGSQFSGPKGFPPAQVQKWFEQQESAWPTPASWPTQKSSQSTVGPEVVVFVEMSVAVVPVGGAAVVVVVVVGVSLQQTEESQLSLHVCSSSQNPQPGSQFSGPKGFPPAQVQKWLEQQESAWPTPFSWPTQKSSQFTVSSGLVVARGVVVVVVVVVGCVGLVVVVVEANIGVVDVRALVVVVVVDSLQHVSSVHAAAGMHGSGSRLLQARLPSQGTYSSG